MTRKRQLGRLHTALKTQWFCFTFSVLIKGISSIHRSLVSIGGSGGLEWNPHGFPWGFPMDIRVVEIFFQLNSVQLEINFCRFTTVRTRTIEGETSGFSCLPSKSPQSSEPHNIDPNLGITTLLTGTALCTSFPIKEDGDQQRSIGNSTHHFQVLPTADYEES